MQACPPGAATVADREIPRILRACRNNNPKLRIGGVLHYGNGDYCPVLEGPKAAVDALYGTIGQDLRHTDVQTLERVRVASRRFPDWSMTYVPFEPDVKRVLERYRMRESNRHEFGPEAIDAMIALLVGAPAPEQQPDQDHSRPRKRGSWLERLRGRA